MNYLKLEECTAWCVYEVISRNFKIAVFDGMKFIGMTHKLGHQVLSRETHYDSDTRFGTVKPIREVSKIDTKTDHELFSFLRGYCENN